MIVESTTVAARLLFGITIDPAKTGQRLARLPFLKNGPVEIRLMKPITILAGENGCGKTTLIEAIAAKCGIKPDGGREYSETEDRRPATALSAAVTVSFAGGKMFSGMILRADKLDKAAKAASGDGMIRMATTGEWRNASHQSRGETILSLLSAALESSERRLFLLDEPEAALSPQRQLALLRLLDDIHRDGRSQVVLATHSTILMAHPEADIFWIDDDGIERRSLEDVDHWRIMRRLTGDRDRFISTLLED
jgi:predicted ATPase